MSKISKAKKLLEEIADALLPMDKASRMQRAKEGGFDTDKTWYHGTRGDIDAFDPGKAKSEGDAIFFTDEPNLASEYAQGVRGAVYPVYLKKGMDQTGFPMPKNEVIEAMSRHEGDQLVADIDTFNRSIDWNKNQYFSNAISDAGEKGVVIRQVEDSPGYDPFGTIPADVAAVTRPENIRSVNAAFDPAKKASKNLMAGVGGVTAGGGLLGAEEAEAVPIVKGGKRIVDAWHGTPHEVDKFRSSQIGTGEGAQVYGYGHYFGDQRSTGEFYRDSLKHRAAIDLEQEAHSRGLPLSREGQMELRRQARADKSDMDAARSLQNASIEARGMSQEKLAELIGVYRKSGKGNLYNVNIDADPDDFLDWDLPLSEQPEGVRDVAVNVFGKRSDKLVSNKIIKEIDRSGYSSGFGIEPYEGKFAVMVDNEIVGDKSGNDVLFNSKDDAINYLKEKIDKATIGKSKGFDLYRALTEEAGGGDIVGQADASRKLQGFGIPGIKYSDGSSRGKEGGTKNWVVFDDDIISIVGKYGIAGAALKLGLTPQQVEAAVTEQTSVGPLSSTSQLDELLFDPADLPQQQPPTDFNGRGYAESERYRKQQEHAERRARIAAPPETAKYLRDIEAWGGVPGDVGSIRAPEGYERANQGIQSDLLYDVTDALTELEDMTGIIGDFMFIPGINNTIKKLNTGEAMNIGDVAEFL